MKIYLISLAALFYSCDPHESNHKEDLKSPIVIDNMAKSDSLIKLENMQKPINYLEFVGRYKDTILLSEKFEFDSNKDLHFSNYNYSKYNKSGLIVYVDNNQVLSIDSERNTPPQYPKPIFISPPEINDTVIKIIKFVPEERNHQTKLLVQSLPVFIFNPTNDTLYLDHQDNRIIMIQEAKDEKGKWRPIEYWLSSKCGNSYGAFQIAPKNLAMVKVFKYTGVFKTELRIKIKNGKNTIYSNTFKASIDKKLFELPINYEFFRYETRVNNEEFKNMIFLNEK
jgi:hypothetical protein